RMEESLNRSRSYPFTAPCVVPALLRRTSEHPQTPPRHLSGAHIPPPRRETGPANLLAVEPSSPANRVFLFSQRSDAMLPESAAYPTHQIRSEEPGPPSPSPCCSPRSAGACMRESSRRTAVRERSSGHATI